METIQPLSLPSPPQWLYAEGWNQFPSLVHGFSSCADDGDQLSSFLEANRWDWRTLKQVHGDDILCITPDTIKDRTVEADGLTTQTDGVLLGIATADCVPVLLVAPQQRVVTALHAG